MNKHLKYFKTLWKHAMLSFNLESVIEHGEIEDPGTMADKSYLWRFVAEAEGVPHDYCVQIKFMALKSDRLLSVEEQLKIIFGELVG